MFLIPGKLFPRNRSYLVYCFNHPDSKPIQSGKNGKDIPYEESNLYNKITDRIKRAKPVTIRPTQTVEMTQTIKNLVSPTQERTFYLYGGKHLSEVD